MTRTGATCRVLVVLLAVSTSACFGAGAQDPPDSATTTPEDPLGTITIEPGAPIELATMLAGASGPGSTTGVDAVRGVRLAVDFLDGKLDGSSGPLLNHPVELVEIPETCEGGRSVETAVPDVDVDVVGVIGPGCARSVRAEPATSLAERGVVMISPTATEAELTDPSQRPPTFFRTAYNDLVEGKAVADYAAGELEALRSGVATDEAGSTGAASSFRSTFEEDLGIVAVSGTLDGPADASRLVRAIALGRPEFVFLVGRRPACADAARESGELPALRAVPVVTSVGCFDPAFVAVDAASPLQYLSGPDLTQMLEDDFYRMEFLPAYQEQFGSSPVGPFHAHAYDATLMLLDAIDRIAEQSEDGTLTIGRTALQEAVAATSGVSGISGMITCSETGDCAPDPTIAVYLVPDVPLAGGSLDAVPVFSETVALADLVTPA
ncbi:MAG TPA: branched-chain amino acid ABC transporter substrate-binding protein [Actinomycetota bacterium]